MFKSIRDDIHAVFERDPAARSLVEIILCYPGVHALMFHRPAHALWKRNWKVPARFLSQIGRFMTGIEIHPGAMIGKRFFIDHGMGIVVGETAQIGDDVTLYQGVTLGGVKFIKGEKRHPTIGNRVVVGAGAAVLGPFTVGDDARIGSNAVVLHPVEPGATVVGVPAHPVGPRSICADDDCFHAYGLRPGEAGDPVYRTIERLSRKVDELEVELNAIKATSDASQTDQGEPVRKAANF